MKMRILIQDVGGAALVMGSGVLPPFWNCLFLGMPQFSVNEQPSQSDSGGTFYVANVSSVAENVNRKVAWESAQCRGLHSNTACKRDNP